MTLFLTSCASEKLFQSEKEINFIKSEAIKSEKSPQSLLEEYETKLNTFDKDTLNFYGPLNIKEANSHVQNAKELIKQTNTELLNSSKVELLFALRNLDNAIKNKAATKLHLKTADTQFNELKNLLSPSLLPEEFKKIEYQFSRLIQLLENGKVQDAIKEQPELIEKMIQLEIETLKKSHLGQATTYTQKAKDLDASKYAPFSLAETEKSLSSAQNLIQKSYRDRNAISTIAKETTNLAKKLYFVSKEAHEIHNLSNEKIEQKLISNYDFIKEIASTLEINPIELQEYPSLKHELIEQIKTYKTMLSASKPLEIITSEKPVQKEKTIAIKPIEAPKVIYSHETNKAVLPELIMPKSYSKPEIADEENLEFDDIEIVK